MAEPTPEKAADAATADGPGSPEAANEPPADNSGEVAGIDILSLPEHARGLLRVRVPVTVSLASQRKPVQEIIELGPGSIVKFDKTCDEPLALMVCGRPIATGEVVKVGDKFGLRIGHLVKG
jgi:flagellar motor switch protein FliN/FliY